MGFLPDFQHDIFVSYAHGNNIPKRGMQNGWVTTLIEDIKEKLDEYLGVPCDLWKDEKIAKDMQFTPQIMEALNNTAIMIIILSPTYINSAWCTREKNNFFARLNDKNKRIFVIEFTAIEDDERPQELADFISFKFWINNGEGMAPKTLGDMDPSKDEHLGKYQNKIDEVAFRLKTTLHELKKKSDSQTEQASAKKELSVFLADTTDDLDQLSKGISTYLNQYGINILPETCYSREPTTFKLNTERDLAKCNAFVQLLSSWPGKKPADMPQGYLQLQYDCACKAGKPVFQWRSPTLDFNTIMDKDHRALVNGEHVRAEGIEEFKRAVKDFVLKPPPVNPSQAHQVSAKNAPKLNTIVFVNTVSSDIHIANKVCDELQKHGIGYFLPTTSIDPSDIRKDLEENYENDDAVIIIYGSSPAGWVRNQLHEFRKILPNRKKNIQAFAICEGPPEEKSPLGMMFPNLQVFDLKKGIDEPNLERQISFFVNSLIKENV